MDLIKWQQLSAPPIEKVVVQSVVLLSIVENYYRVAKDTRKRVVGLLLGSSFEGTVDVTNSYAVPFEENDEDPSIWFLDHNYHEAMFSMFNRINAKEHVVGWYSIGPKLREIDLDVHGLLNDYVPDPVLVIVDVQSKELGISTKAYYAIEEVKENATLESRKVFVHVPSVIAAHEAEEIGVEHLLRDVMHTITSNLVTEEIAAMRDMKSAMAELRMVLDLEKAEIEKKEEDKRPQPRIEVPLDLGKRARQFSSYLEGLYDEIGQGKKKTGDIASLVQRIRDLLIKLPTTYKAEVQPHVSSLCAEADDVISKILDRMKIELDTRHNSLKVSLNQCFEAAQASF